MAAFVIFDQATGAVKGSYMLTNAASLETSMKVHTPKGCGALAVPLAHPATLRNQNWRVVDGKLAHPGDPTEGNGMSR